MVAQEKLFLTALRTIKINITCFMKICRQHYSFLNTVVKHLPWVPPRNGLLDPEDPLCLVSLVLPDDD